MLLVLLYPLCEPSRACRWLLLSEGARARAQPQDKAAIAGRETERTEAAAQLERKMAAMEAALAARRQPVGEAKPEAARGPGADLRFQVRCLYGKVNRAPG